MILALLLIVVLAIVVFVGITVVVQRRRFADANEVVPGVPTDAPASWAGSHEPEALLHRRLRDAVKAMRAIPWMDGAADARAKVEQAALDADQRLVAVASLPAARRTDSLAVLTKAVEAIEDTVASMATSSPGADQPAALEEAKASVLERLQAVIDANAELDRLERGN